MSRKRKEQEQRLQKERRQKRIKTGVIAGVCVLVVAGAIALLGIASRDARITPTVTDSGDLVIPRSQVASKVTYVEYSPFDLLVWIDGEGTARTAFDVCQSCFGQNAHYTQTGDQLICGYCGESFALENLGEAAWGYCQPVAVPVGYREDSASDIVVPAGVLDFAKDMFRQWGQENYTVTLAQYGQEG